MLFSRHKPVDHTHATLGTPNRLLLLLPLDKPIGTTLNTNARRTTVPSLVVVSVTERTRFGFTTRSSSCSNDCCSSHGFPRPTFVVDFIPFQLFLFVVLYIRVILQYGKVWKRFLVQQRETVILSLFLLYKDNECRFPVQDFGRIKTHTENHGDLNNLHFQRDQ